MHRILVADDDQSVRQTLEFILNGKGFHVVLAEDGRCALAKLAEGPIDLVLSDFHMPHFDGIALCSAIKEDPKLGAIPVILMTAAPGPQFAGRAFAAGAVQIFTKPFEVRELIAEITNQLSNDRRPSLTAAGGSADGRSGPGRGPGASLEDDGRRLTGALPEAFDGLPASGSEILLPGHFEDHQNASL